MSNEEFQSLNNFTPENEKEVEIDLVKSGSSAVKEKESAGDVFEDGEGQLSIDVYQTSDEIIVEAPIAGVRSDDLDIDVTTESVTIRGKRERESRIKEDDYFYQECYWGKFSRAVILPQEVDAEKAEASLKHGVLTITLPKLNRQKSRKLKAKLD